MTMAMKKGVCPICGSTEVYVGTTRMKATRSNYYGSNSVPINWATLAPLENFVCITCGYVESYILDAGKLEKIQKHWKRADGKPNEKRKNDE
jgi:hypothetical protein